MCIKIKKEKAPKSPRYNKGGARSKREKENQDWLIKMLKNKFLSLIVEENYPHTPEITDELDYLKKTIEELIRENME